MRTKWKSRKCNEKFIPPNEAVREINETIVWPKLSLKHLLIKCHRACQVIFISWRIAQVKYRIIKWQSWSRGKKKSEENRTILDAAKNSRGKFRKKWGNWRGLGKVGGGKTYTGNLNSRSQYTNMQPAHTSTHQHTHQHSCGSETKPEAPTCPTSDLFLCICWWKKKEMATRKEKRRAQSEMPQKK